MEKISGFIHTLDYAVVVIYLLVLIGIGYWVSFIKKGKNKGKDENLFLAGNSLGATSIGLTMWGTNVGPSMLIASCSIGYTTGIVAGNFSWLAFPFLILLALVFGPKYHEAKTTTLPEFMGKRFGQSTRNILAWYSSVTILVSWLGLTLFAGGIVVQQVLGIPFWLSAVILILIAVFFTVAGGLEAIAYTNVFQMILLIVVSLVLTTIGVVKAGGLMTIYESTPKEYWNLFLPLDNPDYPWIALILGYPVLGVWFWCTDQSMVQSVLGAKSLQHGQLGANLTGWLKILDVILFILPGITCFILFPNLENPDEAYMTMVTQLLPTGAIGLIIAVIIASLISTIDSALNSLSTVFTMDIYVNKYRQQASNKEIIWIGRVVTLVGAVIAVLFALAINTLEGFNLFDLFQAILGFLAPPLSVVFLFAVLWKKMTGRAANVILSVGTIISITVGVMYLWVFPNSEYPIWPHFLLLSFYLFCGMACLAWLITVLDKNASEDKGLIFKPLPKIAPKVKVAWIALTLTMVILYIIFNGHGGTTEAASEDTTNPAPLIENSEAELMGVLQIVLPLDSANAEVPMNELKTIGGNTSKVLRWKNRIIFTNILQSKMDKIASQLEELKLGEVVLFTDNFYDYNRSWCQDTSKAASINEVVMSTSLVEDEAGQNEYLRLHREQPGVWKELSEGFCSEGFQYITMFLNDRQIIMIVGFPDNMDLGEMSRNNAQNNPKVKEWDELMSGYQVGLPGTDEGVKWIAFEPKN